MWTEPKYTETKTKVQRAVDLYVGQEKSVEEVARILDVNNKSVYRYLKSAGVKLRVKKRDNRGRFSTS